MNQIQEGLYAVEEKMPCPPNAITLYRYAIPSTLGRAEQEEAAARILSFSQQLNQWVGVSWHRLVEMMSEEYKAYCSIQKAQIHNSDEQCRLNRAVRKYYIVCALTLGIYAFFVAKPEAQLCKVPEEAQIPLSGIFVFGMFGLNHVMIGINELIEKGFLQRVTEGEGEDAFDVFFPTPSLLSLIMQKQGVVAS